MTSLFLFNIVLAIIWAAVSGEFSELNLLFGFVLGTLTLYIIREQVGGTYYLRRVYRVISLLLLFLYELVLSAWRVAVLVCSPKMQLNPGFVAFPLSITKDAEITLLANLITLARGRVWIMARVVRKPVTRIAAAIHHRPAPMAACVSISFGQKPVNGGRPDTAKANTRKVAANSG